MSNAYSIFLSDNKKYRLYYDIRIFEYMIQTYERNYYLGKNLNIEIIDNSTTQPSNFDDDMIQELEYIFNKEKSSLIKCKIINSYINYNLEQNFPDNLNLYNKEIIILCLYISKDLENSLSNAPRLSIRLDLYKNDLGSDELNLISYITLKDNIAIDVTSSDEEKNYLYPELINFKDKETIYAILKGTQSAEIYNISINIQTLNLIKKDLFINISSDEFSSFAQREFMGSFYIQKYNKENNILSVFINDDSSYKNYEDTEIKFNIINDLGFSSGENIIDIKMTSLSNYLLCILITADTKVQTVFILFPLCDPLQINQELNTLNSVPLNNQNLSPLDISSTKYNSIFVYQNSIIDHISNRQSRASSLCKIEFNPDFLSYNNEENEVLDIIYDDSNNRRINLVGKSHTKDLIVLYYLYFKIDGNDNKFYSPTCKLNINICHPSCNQCSSFFSDDSNPLCITCHESNDYYPLEDQASKCANINEAPIQYYYYDEEQKKFIKCDTSCEYCVGGGADECIKCANSGYFLSEEKLNFTIINSKTYEYSQCIPSCPNIYKYYENYNFENSLSSEQVKVCLEKSNTCPEHFPFLYNDGISDMCYQNCKKSESINIYGSVKKWECVDECDKDCYLLENNTCCYDDKCPEGYYYYPLRFYCVQKCEKNLYHVKEEKKDIDDNTYFELTCQQSCPSSDMVYSFADDDGYKYCIKSCILFNEYYSDYNITYDIYYKNTLICYSKSQCNNFADEYSTKKYVAIINITSQDTSSATLLQKKVCVTECKEVSQILLPYSSIYTDNGEEKSTTDCTIECPDGYGNYSWKCIDCSSQYLYEYKKNCIKKCPPNSYVISDHYPYKCFDTCPEEFPYADTINYKCYENLEDVPTIERKCDKTRFLWYIDYDINNEPFIVCLNETDIYLTCDRVVQEFPYTNKATHECVKVCPEYTIQDDQTKLCEFNMDYDFDFSIILETLLTHEPQTPEKNETNVISHPRDLTDELTISFYLFNFSTVLSKVQNNIKPSISLDTKSGDIRYKSPFYYLNSSEFVLSDECENLLRESYNIPYFIEHEYKEQIIEYVNGIKTERNETKYYYEAVYLLGLVFEIHRDHTSQVEYKLYKPDEPYLEINLAFCKENSDNIINKVNINIEKKLDNNIYDLFDEVKSYYINNINEKFEGKSSEKYVYDIFDKNCDFFENPCTPFASKYGADILIKDRYELFFTELNFCEENCTYLDSIKSYKNENNFIQVKCLCDIKERYFKENEINFGKIGNGNQIDYNIKLQTVKSNFICYNKIINIKSIFSKENSLGLLTLICFILIISLYVAQCILSTNHIDEILKMIRLGKYDHGLNMFLTLKEFLKEKKKREECYKRRKDLKKVKLTHKKPKNMNIIEAQQKIQKAENNVQRKFEGEEMIPEQKDELELIRERINNLEDKLKLKYEKKGMKDKKIKIKIKKEEPPEIKKIRQEIKLSQKRLEDLRKKKREIDLEKLKYHSFSSMASFPSYPPKKIRSEIPMSDEIDDESMVKSKEEMIKKNKKKKEHKNKKNKLSDNAKEEKIEEYEKEEVKTEESKKEEEKEIKIKEEILSLNTNKVEKQSNNSESIKNKEEEEEKNEDNKDPEIISESKLDSDWESYDSKDPKGKNKKKKAKEKKEKLTLKEKKEIEIQKKLVEKRIKDIEKRMELLPEEEVKERKKLEKEKKKKEMLDKGILFKEDIKDKKTENNINTEIINSENILNTEDKKEQEQENNNNDITIGDKDIPEENLSEMINEEEEEGENKSEKITEIKTKKEKKSKKDAFYKTILKKKYKFKYMKLFYEEYPYNFPRDYSIINFNDLFTSDDFYYLYVDIEINDMIYRRALKEDRRNFLEMYWSFIKYKNNFLFCVVPDYFNLILIKIALLIYSLSLYPLFSCLFITDDLIHKMYIESNQNQKHTLLYTNSVSIVQYIFSPIIIEIIIYLLKRFVLIEKKILDFIHKKKYHSNYVLQEIVKGHDVRDEQDEKEKNEILLSIQEMNKKKHEDKENDKKIDEIAVGVGGEENGGGEFSGKKLDKSEHDYYKDFEENKTLINELRLELSDYQEKVNNKNTFFFLFIFIFGFFNFYYVTVFTMTYYNCIQKVIIGTFIPLLINFAYPIINCLFFVSLRYFALNRGFINLYKFSKILSYI